MSKKSAEELRKALKEEPGERFEALLSNPPYQAPGGGNGKSVAVWQEFLYASMVLAEKVSMIAPARWRYGASGREKEILSYLRGRFDDIVSVNIYDPSEALFPGTLIRDGVGILLLDSGRSGEINGIKWVENGQKFIKTSLDESPFDPTAVALFEGIRLPAIEFSNYTVSTGQSRLRRYTKDAEVARSETHTIRTLAVYGGLGTGRSWRYMRPEAWTKNTESIFSSYKFGALGSTSNIRSVPLDLAEDGGLILEPDEFMGEGGRFIVCNSKVETENLQKYFKTKVIHYLLKATMHGRGNCTSELVPDLGDYTDSNPHIDWSQPLDPQLYELFGLTDEEIAVVEEGLPEVACD